jgi:hypothetical protein
MVASLTIIVYDRNIFIVQATELDQTRDQVEIRIFSFPEQSDSDRRMNSKFALGCWERSTDPEVESDPSKPPCIWQLFPDEPEENVKPEDD